MQAITTNTPLASKKARSPHEKRFDEAWQRVVNQQKKNDRLRVDVLAFARDTRARIQDKEQAYMDAMHCACLHLLSFFSRKSLPQWQRQTLMDWVAQYLEIMQDSPFGSHLNMKLIRQRLADAQAATYPDLQDPFGHPADDMEFGEFSSSMFDEEAPFNEDMFQDLFAEFEHTDAASDSGQRWNEADADKAFFQQQRAHEQQRHDESQALKKLMKSSSINTLFRKVAGILHPDKEPDETARRDKNRLMAELIQARNTHDIPRLFAFYAEYVGQSPLQELGGDLEGVTQLLQRQYLYLYDQQVRILDEDPLASVLYRRFHRKTPAATQRAINKHLKETQTQTDLLRALPQEVTSLKKLKPYLELHYEMLILEDDLDFM